MAEIEFDRFQGDPKMLLNEEGSNLKYVGGQPIMDQGAENPVMIQLFTRKGWFGNYLFRRPEEKIGSDWEKNNEQAITIASLNENRMAGEKALQPLVDSGFLEVVEVSVTNPTGHSKTATFNLGPANGVLQFSSNGVNWQQQALHPAYART